MANATNSPLLEQGFADCATVLNGFGPFGQDVAKADVERIHGMWSAITDEDRHLVALCFMQFDGNREVFGASAA